MAIQVKKYGVYHWDTFDGGVILLKDFDELLKAKKYLQNRYKGRLDSKGADKVEIVTKEGDIVESYSTC